VPKLTGIVAGLPAAVPFVGPEALERQSGRPMVARLGANENLFGPSASVRAAMRDALAESALYGDPEGWELRVAIARHHGLTPEHIVLGAGVDELLGLVVQAYLEPGEVAAMSTGAYPTFAYQVATHGGRFARVPYRNFANDAEALVELARESGAKLLYLSNPDNPTGSWLSAETQLAILDRLPPDCLFLLDEAYGEFAPPGTLPEISCDDPRVIRFRTFSKVHGLAGMRVGYVFGAPEVVRPLDRIRNQFGVGRVAQAAALAALADQDHVRQMVAAIAEGRRDYAATAARHGFEALPSATNFVAIDMGDGDRARAVLRALIEQEGVFVRMPGVAPLDRCVRITVGPAPDRQIFAEAFSRVVGAL
jgi:histidinol-phosphate aminotransferase